MSRRALPVLAVALLVALGTAACSSGDTPSDDAPSVSAPSLAADDADIATATATATVGDTDVDTTAAPSDGGSVRTQAGGGTLTFTGEFTETVSFDSTDCLFLDGKLVNFEAPAADMEPDNPWLVNGSPSYFALGRGDTITGGTIHEGPDVDGTTLTFTNIAVTVTDDTKNMTAELSGTLTCSRIEE